MASAAFDLYLPKMSITFLTEDIVSSVFLTTNIEAKALPTTLATDITVPLFSISNLKKLRTLFNPSATLSATESQSTFSSACEISSIPSRILGAAFSKTCIILPSICDFNKVSWPDTVSFIVSAIFCAAPSEFLTAFVSLLKS